MQEGETLGHYRILGRLGAGAMGEVFEAEDTRLGRTVALKTLKQDRSRAAERRARFEREARAIAALDHPNIVTIYSVEESEGTVFFTMELIRGRSLAGLVREGGLGLDEILSIAIPLCDAVGAAHEQGITHRDLKPENVLIREDGLLKVLDFGVAKLTEEGETDLGEQGESDLTVEGRLIGTVSYMSPEQAEGKAVDPRSDVFSLGILLYLLATGQRPFEGDSRAATLTSVLRDEPAPLTTIHPELPDELGRIVERSLRKAPEERFANALELRTALETLGPAAGKERERSSERERDSRGTSSRGRRATWLVLAAAVLAASVLLGVLLRRDPGAEPASPALSGRTRIAVLPLENLGPPEDAYFAAGMTAAITNRLAAVGRLAVISRSSAADYDRRGRSMKQIGADLGVDYVLEGTVQWDRSAGGSGRVLITPQLIRVADDTYLWSESYDRILDDIFAVQSEIAEAVTRQLDITLLEPERRALTVRPTEVLEAYQVYMRGMTHAARWLEDDLRLAASMFERAVELDPEFALAYARLSMVHSELFRLGYDRSELRRERAREAAEAALAIAPQLPEAHLALGRYFSDGLRDDDRALEQLMLAERELPNDSEAPFFIAMIRRRRGEFEDAISGFRTAALLDPQNVEPPMQVGITYTYTRRYAEAEPFYERALALAVAPDRGALYWIHARNPLLWRGDLGAARAILDGMPRGDDPWSVFIRFQLPWLERDFATALELTESTAIEIVPTPWALYPTATLRASAHAALGQLDRARDAYQEAVGVLEREAAAHPEDTRVLAALGIAHAGLGQRDRAVREGERAVEALPTSRDAFVNATVRLESLAEIHAMVGNSTEAVEILRDLLEVPSLVSVPMLRLDPRWDGLRDDPAFRALVSPRE